jgi:RND family efflux transporter MFP subunit
MESGIIVMMSAKGCAMTRSQTWGVLATLLVAGWTAAVTHAQATAPESPSVLTGLTKPSERLELSLYAAGVVAEVKVKPGDHIKVGQLLLAEDIRAEVLELDSLRIDAESDLAAQASKVNAEVKKVELERIQKMHANKVATDQELEEARLNAEVARLQGLKAVQDQRQAQLKADKQKVRIQQMQLSSPIDGQVDSIDRNPGEVVDPVKPLCTVVKNDPLWVEVHVPVSQSLLLKLGQTLPVRYNGDDKPAEAKVIYLAPQADAASNTQLVRLEMPNPSGRASGLQVQVDVTGK